MRSETISERFFFFARTLICSGVAHCKTKQPPRPPLALPTIATVMAGGPLRTAVVGEGEVAERHPDGRRRCRAIVDDRAVDDPAHFLQSTWPMAQSC